MNATGTNSKEARLKIQDFRQTLQLGLLQKSADNYLDISKPIPLVILGAATGEYK